MSIRRGSPTVMCTSRTCSSNVTSLWELRRDADLSLRPGLQRNRRGPGPGLQDGALAEEELQDVPACLDLLRDLLGSPAAAPAKEFLGEAGHQSLAVGQHHGLLHVGVSLESGVPVAVV